jgi:hypothetical protein
MPGAWATGTPDERANIVRSHRNFPVETLLDLFCLTRAGAFAILGGDVWQPEYSREGNPMSRIADKFFGDRAPPWAGRAAYPDAPGFKERTTSREAAAAVESGASILRERVFNAIAAAGDRGMTADEAAAAISESVLAVRPRVTELAKAAPPRVEPTGVRRKNESGLNAKVWRAT